MQVLIELLAGLIALLAAAALSHFGVDLHPQRDAEAEIHRIVDCPEPSHQRTLTVDSVKDIQDC